MKNIALVIENDNQFYTELATNIVNNNGNDKFNYTILPLNDINNDIIKLLLLAKNYDLLHFLSGSQILNISIDQIKKKIEDLGGDYTSFYNQYIKNVNISANSDCPIDGSLFKKIMIYDKEIKGLDLNTFYPQNIKRYNSLNRPIIIGMIYKNEEDKNNIEKIIRKKYDKELIFLYLDYKSLNASYYKRVEFYNKIDLFINLDNSDNYFLETIGCGVPTIYKVDNKTSKILHENGLKLVVKNFNKEELCRIIDYILENPNVLSRISEENINIRKSLNFDIIAEKYNNFFNFVLN